MHVVLIHYAAPPVVGGVETVLARQAQAMRQAGHTVRILAGRGQAWDGAIPVEVHPGLDSRQPDVLRMKESLDRGCVPDELPALVESLEAELRQALSGADAVILHNVASLHKNLALTAALYNLSQIPGNTRWILWHHDLAWTTPRYRPELHPGWPWDLLRTAWPGARQVVVSEARQGELADLMDIPTSSITVIPAGLDLMEFINLSEPVRRLANRLKLLEAAPLLLAPVRLTRRKNLELAIRTLAALRKDMPAAVLVITGPPGPHNPANAAYFEELQALRTGLALEGAVHLLAEYMPDGLTDPQVADFYRLADALLMPSREEGFGIPILEAGLGRLPIFCSDLPPLRTLAGEYATYFDPDDSPEKVARLIEKRLSEDPLYQMRSRVRAQFTWEAVYAHRIAPLLEVS